MNQDDESLMETLGLDERALELEHGATLTPAQLPRPRLIDRLEVLPRFDFETTSVGGAADFRVVDRLGEGGMGVVSLAEQTALGRLVAVKEPKQGGAHAKEQVVREALVMGRVEHPNVVPAYVLGCRDGERPVLVMKRIEGTSWEDVIAGNAPVPGGGEADLAWHLRVLLQVCNALRFAHSRKIVHRDIKPENVMVGEFGEVYLLDWGIALSLEDGAEHGLPTRQTSRGIAGTPAFMAPEMTRDDARDIDERTDVYLLGACLHVLLTGEPPHTGATILQVIAHAMRSEAPVYGSDVPGELASIATKAMAREKEDRYSSVDEFADALWGYLEHRASYALSDLAHELLEDVRGDTSVEATHRLVEAELVFQRALEIWEHNESARVGLQEALEERVRACLAREDIDGARAGFERLPAPKEELEERIDALAHELEARSMRIGYLENFAQELDLERGAQSRRRLVASTGLAFVALCVWQAWEARPGQPVADTQASLSTFWRPAAIAVVGVAAFWKKIMVNVANRRLVAIFLSVLVAMWLLRLSVVRHGDGAVHLQAAEIVVIGLATFAAGLFASRQLAAVAGVAYGGAALVAIAGGQMWIALSALAAAHLVFFSAMAWIWRPKRAPG